MTEKIVVLDGYTLNPGDLSWAGLDKLGECAVHDRTPPEKVLERTAGAGIVLTNKTVLGSEFIERMEGLRYIGLLSTGYNVVDLPAADRGGVTVTNVPAYSTSSVAQLTFALIFELARRVGHHARACADGRWSESRDFCFWDYPQVELDGLVIGLVGFGNIGRAVAAAAGAFGMEVIAHRPGVTGKCPETGVEMVSLDEIFRRSDIISLHCPLTPENAGLVNAERLARAKPGAWLINTARGPLVDEPALAEALDSGRLAGAGLDVLSSEPPAADNPLLKARNCLVTPHIAWATRAARARLMDQVVGNLAAFLAGKPRNTVNNPRR